MSIIKTFKNTIRKSFQYIFYLIFPKFRKLDEINFDLLIRQERIVDSSLSIECKIYSPHEISNCEIDSYTYVAPNSHISLATIGKFCSIGPNFLCGYGIHPTNGISTSPMFYSTMKQNGVSFCDSTKTIERRRIFIGNDVFIGANVTVLDGVTIGDGAVIGAGALVTKDIPPYAIAVGVPIRIIRYRFTEEQISKLLKIRWWNFKEENLKDVERMFFDIDSFLEKYS